MKVLITGHKGLLGRELLNNFKEDYQVEGIDLPEFDITDFDRLRKKLYSFFPKVIINCAAYTNVDGCEDNRELCKKVNSESVKILTDYCVENKSLLIHYSTDYVFNGETGPNEIDDIADPINYYGLTKFIGEYEILRKKDLDYIIIRTNVLYGDSGKANFIKWLFDKLSNSEKVNIVNDQFSNPCYVKDLVKFTKYVIKNDMYRNIFHTGSQEYLDRYSFALKFAEIFEFDKSLISSVNSKIFKQKAKRPLKGGLSLKNTEKITGYRFWDLEKSFYDIKGNIDRRK